MNSEYDPTLGEASTQSGGCVKWIGKHCRPRAFLVHPPANLYNTCTSTGDRGHTFTPHVIFRPAKCIW